MLGLALLPWTWVALFAAGAAGADTPVVSDSPAHARLRAGLEALDRDQLLRVAMDMTIDDLARALTHPDPDLQRAALLAVPAGRTAWHHLPALATLTKTWDRERAVGAAAAARQIMTGLRASPGDATDAATVALGLGAGETQALDAETASALSARWREIAVDVSRWPDVRVAALEVARGLDEIAGAEATADGYAALFADRAVGVRRATAELIGDPPPRWARVELGRLVNQDAAPPVVWAAAQALCAGLAHGDPPGDVEAALGDPGLRRLADLAHADDLTALSPGAILDGARCLNLRASERGALDHLAQRGPRTIRRALGALRTARARDRDLP